MKKITILLLLALASSCTAVKQTQPATIRLTVIKINHTDNWYQVFFKRGHSRYMTYAKQLPDSVKVGTIVNINPIIKTNQP